MPAPSTIVNAEPAPCKVSVSLRLRSPVSADFSFVPAWVKVNVPAGRWMTSAPAVLFAAITASRSEILPSAPGLAIRASSEPVLPSTTSAVVVTTSGPPTSVMATAIAWLTPSVPSKARTVTA